MPQYIRSFLPGGTLFFTVITYKRIPIFKSEEARRLLRESFLEVKRELPFEMTAIVLLPDHLHCVWTLPEGDSDYSKRWGIIKKTFTQAWTLGKEESFNPPVSASRAKHRESAVWQRRFWEHTIRDEDDLRAHIDYIHYNPVKHGYSCCAHDWPHSSFSRWVEGGFYKDTWCCGCGEEEIEEPKFSGLDLKHME